MDTPILPLITPAPEFAIRGYPAVTDSLETAFIIPGFRGLLLNASGWSHKATMHFAFETVRNPGNLKNQVQRILHHIVRGESDHVFGALIDLFIVLQDKGETLKERMLSNARKTLKMEQYQAMQRLMATTLPEPDDYPESRHSLLSKESDRLRPLIDIIPAPDSLAVTDSADSALTDKTLDTNRKELEAMLLNGSKDYQLHKKLVELYIHTGDKNSFIQTFSKIDTQQSDLLDLWRKAYDSFKVEDL